MKSCSIQAKDYFLIVKCVRDRKTWIHQLIKIYSDFILKKVLIKPDKVGPGLWNFHNGLRAVNQISMEILEQF